ncbi:MAG TPA: ACT domain-containing protein [Acidimicrobiales bacterium]|nr:ACT domain-containing protein [Acidimicrobiales bacterium]
MAHLAVTAFGVDRPGIVATVTGVLVEHGGNLEDTAMTILGGHFAMMLVVEVPDEEGADALEAALVDAVAPLGLTVVVRPIDDAGSARATGSPWAVSVYGADQPGIVHRVTQLLADRGANVADLSTRVVGPAGAPAYVMLLEVVLPDDVDPDELGDELRRVAGDLGVEVHLRPDDADVL